MATKSSEGVKMMEWGITLLIIGAILVYGARLFTKILKKVSLLAFKIIGLIIAIVGVLFVFEIL